MKIWKATLSFLKTRPNGLVAYAFFLVFVLIALSITGETWFMAGALGAAIGLGGSLVNRGD